MLTQDSSKRVSVAKGAILVVGMRWTDRLIGMLSTLILARILLPEDFGVVAMASIVVGLIDTILDLGVGSALVQNKHASRAEFDTAWTLRLFQAALAAGAMWVAAPIAAKYFGDERVIDVIRVMSVAVLIGGFENIGIVAFQKNMEFGRDFQFFFYRRLAGFLVTLVLALTLKSYWAMVFGTLFGRTIGVIVSYLLHEYRPHFSLQSRKKIWSFSQWVLVGNLGSYGLTQIDKFLVGGQGNAASMGAYSLADDIAAMPTTELLSPLNRVLFPVFVDHAHDPERLRQVFCKAIGVQILLALPAGVGLCVVAPEAVLVLLGERWVGAVPLVQTLALISVFSALIYGCSFLLMALGKVGVQAAMVWVRFGLMLGLAIVIFPDAGVQGIAFIRLAVSGIGLALFVGLVLHYFERIRLSDFFNQTWRPVCATLAMAAAIASLPALAVGGAIGQLLLNVMVGGMVYASVILSLWRIVGCTDGAEAYLLELLKVRQGVMKLMRCKA